MSVVRIVEQERQADGSFLATVAFDDISEYVIVIADPADADAEHEFAWYFEEHLRFPFLDRDREQAACGLIISYGEALFGQLFTSGAVVDYRRMRDSGFDGCRLEV